MVRQVPRPRLYDDALRSRLLICATEAIASGGVDALSVRAVAAAAGTSTNAIYTLFGGRDGLVDAVVATVGASFLAEQVAVPRTADARGDLLELGRAYRRWALAHPEMYAVMFGGRVHLPELAPGKMDGSEEAIRPLFELAARAHEAAGPSARPVEPAVLAMSIWGVVHGAVMLELTALAGQPDTWRSALYERQMEMMGEFWFGPSER